MSRQQFLTKKQDQQIIDAINRTEKRTSGEVRVHIEETCNDDPLNRAAQIFHDLGMDQTQRQNGVLIYVATDDHKTAVYAGKGIHKQVEEHFWNDVIDLIITHFKKDEYELGLEKAVQKVGHKLEELFPYKKGDTDELSNEISYQKNK